MKKIFRRLLSVFLAVIMATSITVTPAFASSRTYTTGGSGKTGVTFTVKTGSSSASRKLSFQQKKGVLSYQNIFTGTSTCKTYSRFCIYVQETCGSSKAYYCDYKSSTTITLKSNTTYKISVVPTERQFVYQHLLDSGKLSKASFLGWSYGQSYWSTYPTWTISTKAVISGVNSTSLNTSIY